MKSEDTSQRDIDEIFSWKLDGNFTIMNVRIAIYKYMKQMDDPFVFFSSFSSCCLYNINSEGGSSMTTFEIK